MPKQNSQRAKELIKKLNDKRKQQAKQIDILCNDMVEAHGDFVSQLRLLNFSAGFYEAILGLNDTKALLDKSASLISDCVIHSNVAIFLSETNTFEAHQTDDDYINDLEPENLEKFFVPEITQNICRSNTIFSLDKIIEMALEAGPGVLAKLSAAAIPLGKIGDSVGFIFIYRSSEHQLSQNEIQRVASISVGLCSAIKACLPKTQDSELQAQS